MGQVMSTNGMGDGSVKQIAQAKGKPLSSGRNFP
jgi:hypothetical protein